MLQSWAQQHGRSECSNAAAAVHETIRVKSAAWDDNSVLIYTTLNHIKYCLPNGDSGIIRTLDVPVYITKVFGSTIYCLDRDGKNRQIQVRCSDDPAPACWPELWCGPTLRPDPKRASVKRVPSALLGALQSGSCRR